MKTIMKKHPIHFSGMFQTMNIKVNRLTQAVVKAGLITSLVASTAHAIDIEPPKYNAVDRNLVNIITGMPQFSLTDLTIGGEMGLSHSISSSSGSFVSRKSNTDDPWGYTDSFMGFLRDLRGDTGFPYNKNGAQVHEENTFKVFGGGHSQTFFRLDDGSFYSEDDSRYTLEKVNDTTYVMTTPEGTELTYSTTALHRDNEARLTKVKQANGFTQYIHSVAAHGFLLGVYSVTTNTGYQVKYIYENSTRQDIPQVDGIPSNAISSNVNGWAREMPAGIIGLNNTYEYCTAEDKTCSSFNGNWPTVSYQWPDGVPLSMYLDKEEVFSVLDAWGRTTEYYHKGFGGLWHPEDNNATPLVSRVTKVKDATSDTINRSYDYTFRKNSMAAGPFARSFQAVGEATICVADNTPGVQNECPKVLNNGEEAPLQDTSGDSMLYVIGKSGQNRRLDNYSDGYRSSGVTKWSDLGTIRALDLPDQTVIFDSRNGHFVDNGEDIFINVNRPTEVVNKLGGTTLLYEYVGDSQARTVTLDDMQRYKNANIKKITERRTDGNKPLVTEAEYISCNSSNRKYCNQPIWVKDPRGLVTHYQYHTPSGQIELVTPPKNANGVSQVVHTEYEQMYAFYKQSASGTATRAPDPIWLKVKETSCATSQYNKDSQTCAAGDNDKIVTAFEYDAHHNLNLVGTAVTAGGKTLRTCYQYDQYGNKISESQPKANSNATTCVIAR